MVTDAAKNSVRVGALQRMAQLPARAAGKKSKLGAARPALQPLVRDQPPFSRHVSRARLCAPIDFLKTRFHFFIRNRRAERGDPIRRQAPVIVVTGTILPLVDFSVGDALAGKKTDSVDNRLVKRSVHVHEYAVDIENNQFWRQLHRILSIARSTLRVSARVPALMRTNPSRGKSLRPRTRIPLRSRARTRRRAAGPKSASTKFALLG